MQLRRFPPTVGCCNLRQDVFRAGFGIVYEDVKVAVVIEDAGVQQFVLHLVPGATTVYRYQVGVGIGRLRVLVEILHVRVGRRAVEIEVILFHVLAMVAFAVGEPEEPFLQDWVLPIPHGQRETEALFVIGNAGETILAPAVGARAGVIVGEEIPGVTVFTVVLAHGPPLALAEVWSPLLPGSFLLSRLFKSTLFCVQD
jgi:hypothetical protein